MPQHPEYIEPPEGLVFVGGPADGERFKVEGSGLTTFQIINGALDDRRQDEYTLVHLVFRKHTGPGELDWENVVIKYMRHRSIDDVVSMKRLLKGYRRKPRSTTNAT